LCTLHSSSSSSSKLHNNSKNLTTCHYASNNTKKKKLSNLVCSCIIKKLIVPKPTNLFLQVIKNTYYIIVLCDDIHNHSTPILVSELMNIGACLSILGTITNLQHSFQHTPHLCLSIVQMTNSNLPISILKIISESNLRGEFLRDSHTTTIMWLLLFYLHERIVHKQQILIMIQRVCIPHFPSSNEKL
jgi:hypothetical protein